MLFISLFIIPVLRFVLTCKLIMRSSLPGHPEFNSPKSAVILESRPARSVPASVVIKKENNGYWTETFQYDLFL